MKRITKDAFDKYREEMGADVVDDLLAAFGLGPKYVAPEKQLFRCPKCEGENAYWHEFGSDCDGGQNYMAIYCPECGHEFENPEKQMKKTIDQEFGSRLVKLNTGARGLRCGLHVAARQVEGDEPIVSFVASDNSVDRYNEVIDQKAWGDFKNFKRNPAITDCHNYSSITFKLGSAVRYEVKNGLLENDVLFAVVNPLGKIAYDMARTGHLPTQSVGFVPEEWQNGVGKDQPERTYTKCDLLEIALTVVPANPNASNIKKAFEAGALEKSDLRELAQWLKQFCSDEKPDPAGKGSASAAGVLDAQLVQIARSLNEALKRA